LRLFSSFFAGILVMTAARAAIADPPTLKAPVAVETPAVAYPEDGEGDAVVVLELLVGLDGSVESVGVLEGEEPFASAAKRAALAWRYQPAQREGSPVRARIRARVAFQAPEVEEPEPDADHPPPRAAGRGPAESTGAPPPPEPEEVHVRGERRSPPASHRLGSSEVRQLPGAFGDPFRAIEALPGVTPIASGVPYFFVRGAPPGNTGYLLDGVRVPALFHVGVGPSVVHPALIDHVDFYPGPAPAQYGRFAGGMVAGALREPEARTHGEATLRLFDAGGLVETPIGGDRGTVLAAARYSYAGLVSPIFAPDTRFGYWDYQSRVTWKTSKDDTLSLLALGTDDSLLQRDGPTDPFKEQIGFTFHRLDLRFDHRLPNGGRMRVAATVGYDRSSQYDIDIAKRMVGTRFELEQPLSDSLRFYAGTDALFEPYDAANGAGDAAIVFPQRDNVTGGAYAELRWDATDRLQISPGVRADFFASTTSGDQVAIVAADPRLRARVALSHDWAWTLGAAMAHQPPGAFVSFPGLEVGRLADGLQEARQFSSGLEGVLPAGFSASATVFYNEYRGLSDASFTCPNLANFQVAASCTTDHVAGSAAGVEVLVRRAFTERVAGLVAYTYSHSVRQLPGVYGDDASVTSKFDRPHVLNVILSADLGAGWFAGGRLFAYSGAPYSRLYERSIPPYNEQRLDPFNRLDLRLEKRWTVSGGRVQLSLYAEMLNALLSKESVGVKCRNDLVTGGAFLDPTCQQSYVGPVAIPSLGIEGKI
jgi:hypothetical protein